MFLNGALRAVFILERITIFPSQVVVVHLCSALLPPLLKPRCLEARVLAAKTSELTRPIASVVLSRNSRFCSGERSVVRPTRGGRKPGRGLLFSSTACFSKAASLFLSSRTSFSCASGAAPFRARGFRADGGVFTGDCAADPAAAAVVGLRCIAGDGYTRWPATMAVIVRAFACVRVVLRIAGCDQRLSA